MARCLPRLAEATLELFPLGNPMQKYNKKMGKTQEFMTAYR